MAVLLSRHNPKRIILREANTPDSSLKSLPMEFIGRIGYRFLYNRAHHVICNSLHVSLRLAELGVKSERLEIIPNPVDLSDINMLADEVAIVPKFHDQNLPLFVSIGRLAVQKGMDRLIEWVAQMKMEANLLIIGEGSELSKITEKIDRHSCHGKVKVIGFQKNPFPFMAKSSAVLLGSRWEGLPNVALEALALGKKVIASRECESLLHLKNTFSVAKLSVPETDEAYVMALDDIACDFRINAKSTTAAPQSALPSEFNLKDVCDRYRKLIFGD